MSAWTEKFIKVNQFSRPADKLNGVKKLVLHYTANNGATAENHFSYFNNITDRYASAHMFVDKTEALNIIPLNEVAYHANDVQKRNADESPWRGVKELLPNANFLSIGVEMCLEKDGTFHPDTVSRTEDVFVQLCDQFKLDPLNDIVRHFDITTKNCPAPWVTDGQKFIDFKNRVNVKLNPPKPKPVVPDNPKTDSKQTSYTIIKGDTYSKVAPKFGLTVNDLRKFNPRVDENKLQIGDVIYLVPVPNQPVKQENKPISNPVQKKYVVLPVNADSWSVYPLDKAPVKANAKGYLNPKKYHGLEYEILGNPQKDVYTIQTGSFGKVNIYVAPSTGATIVIK